MTEKLYLVEGWVQSTQNVCKKVYAKSAKDASEKIDAFFHAKTHIDINDSFFEAKEIEEKLK